MLYVEHSENSIMLSNIYIQVKWSVAQIFIVPINTYLSTKFIAKSSMKEYLTWNVIDWKNVFLDIVFLYKYTYINLHQLGIKNIVQAPKGNRAKIWINTLSDKLHKHSYNLILRTIEVLLLYTSMLRTRYKFLIDTYLHVFYSLYSVTERKKQNASHRLIARRVG